MAEPTKPSALSAAAMQQALIALPEWVWQNNALHAAYRFKDFQTAMAFINQVASSAEALHHHPEWTNVYNRVTIKLTTHDAGNQVTMLDIELAKAISAAAAAHQR